MSKEIDRQVVQMEFDNAGFEKKVKQTTSSLNELEKSMNFKNAGKSFEAIDRAANNVKLDGIMNALDKLNGRFSTLGVMGMTVINRLTNAALDGFGKVLAQIKSGGISRAMNIEKAKFQLQGLKVQWDQISSDIEYGVNDTAYGLDAAANVASQLVASGVTLGENMKSSLRAISGVAAMTNSTYEEIGSIFTTVAGQSQLMTMQLRQLEARGLNAAATLGEQLGKTEAEIRDMVSKGKINFEMFSKAMNDAFGEHAKEANKTLTGVFANTKSALSRIGAEFIQPLIKNEGPLVNFLEAIRVKINMFKKQIVPFAGIITDQIINVLGKLQKVIEGFSFSLSPAITTFKNFEDGLIKIGHTIKPIFTAIKEAFTEVFGKINIGKSLYMASLKFKEATANFTADARTFALIKTIFKGVFTVVETGIKLLGVAIDVFKRATPYIVTFGKVLLAVAAIIANTITKVLTSLKDFSFVGNALDRLREKISGLKNVDTSGAIESIDKLKEKLTSLTGPAEFLVKIFNVVKKVLDNVLPVLKAVGSAIGAFLKIFFEDLAKAFNNANLGQASTILNGGILALVLMKLKGVLSNLGLLINKVKSGPFEPLTRALNNLSSTLYEMQNNLKANSLLKLAGAIAIMAASVIALTGIDPSDLGKAIGAIAALAGVLIATMAIFEKMNSKFLAAAADKDGIGGKIQKALGLQEGKNTMQLQASMNALLTLSASLFIVSMSVAKLAKLDTKSMITSVIAVGGLMVLMTGIALKLDKNKNILQNDNDPTKGLIKLATSLLIVCGSVKMLSGIPLESLIVSLASAIVLIKVLQKAAIEMGKSNASMKGATGFIGLATGVLILAKAVKAFSDMGLYENIKGLGAVITVLTAFTLASKHVDTGGVMALGGALLIASVGFLAMAGALKIFASIGDLTTMIASVGGFLVLLLGFAAAGAIVQKSIGGILALGTALTVASIGFLAIASAFAILQNVDILNGMVVLTAALAEFTIAALLIGKNIAGILALSVGLIALGGSIMIIASAMAILNALDPLKTLIGLVEVTALIAAFAVASTLLAPLVPGMLLFSGAIAALGAGLVLVGAGLTLVTAGLTSFVVALPVILKSLNLMLGELIELLSHLLLALIELAVKAVDGFLNTLADHMPSIVDGLGRLLVGVFDGLSKWIPKVADSFVKLLGHLLMGFGVALDENSELIEAAIEKFMVGLFDFVWDALKGALKGAWEILEDFWGDIIEWGQKVGKKIHNWIWGIKDDMENKSYMAGAGGGRGFSDGFEDGLEEGSDDAKDAAASLKDDVSGVLKGGEKDAKDAGTAIGSGFTNAISDSEKKGESKLANFGSGIVSTIQNTVGTTIPEMGSFTGIGFIDNMVNAVASENSVNKIDNAVTKVYDHWIDKTEAFKLATENILKETGSLYGRTADQIAEYAKTLETGTKLQNAALDILATEGSLAGYDLNALAARAGIKNLQPIERAIEKTGEVAEDTSEKVKDLGTSAKKTSKHVQTLAERLKSSLNIFTEFNKEASLSAKELKDNLQSQFEGYSNWIDNLQNLMSRHIDKDVFKYLLDLGPSGAETVKTFVGKSDKWIKDYAKTLKNVNGLLTNDVFKPMEKYAETGKTTMDKIHESVDYLAAHTDDTLAKLEARIESFTQSFKELGESMSLSITDSVSNTAKQVYWAAKDTDAALKNFKENLMNLRSRGATDEFIEYLVKNNEVDLTRTLAWGSQTVLDSYMKLVMKPKTKKYYENMVREVLTAEYDGIHASTDYLAGKEAVNGDAKVKAEDLMTASKSTSKFLDIFTRKYGNFLKQMGATDAYKAAYTALYHFTKAEWDAMESTEQLKEAYTAGSISYQYYMEQKLIGMTEVYNAFTESIKENISSQIDLFSSFNKQTQKAYQITLNILDEFDRKTDMTSEDILTNMRNNVNGAKEWANNLTILAARGLNDGLLAELTELGPAGYEKVNAFVEMTADQLSEANSLWGESLNLTLSDYVNQKLYPDLDTSNMLGSMNSELTAIKKWGDNLNKLFASNLDTGILQYLSDLGPAGADKVETFAKMTASEIEQANHYWTEAMSVSDNLGEEIAANWVTIGEYQVNGFIQGIEDKDSELKQAGEKMSDTVQEGVEESAKISNGKSEATSEEAQAMVDGITDTIEANTENAKKVAETFAREVYKAMSMNWLNVTHGQRLAGYIVAGLEDGFTKTEKIKPALVASENLAKAIYDVFRKFLKIESPSKVFKEVGGYICAGLANGIDEGSSMAEASMESMADNMIAMTYAVLDDIMDSDGFTPTITPVLDTTNIQNGVDWINGAFNDPKVGMVAASFSMSRNDDLTAMVSSAVDKAMDKYTRAVEDAIRNHSTDVNVDISLEGDAAGLFRSVRSQNEVYKKMTGKSALV